MSSKDTSLIKENKMKKKEKKKKKKKKKKRKDNNQNCYDCSIHSHLVSLSNHQKNHSQPNLTTGISMTGQ